MNNTSHKILTAVLILLSLGIFVPILHQSLAQTFDSDSYHIDWGNFNMTSGKKSSTNYLLTDTVGQNAPGQFDNTGYILKSGFQYIYDLSRNQFSFDIDDLTIDLGLLVPDVGSTDTNIITISTPSNKGYEILTSEDHPLQIVSTNYTIPDTTCDSGTCNETVSGVWTSNSAYGFGFTAIGIDTSGVVTNLGTSAYFSDNTYYKQFANGNNNEPPQVFMSEDEPVTEHSARIIYKALISTQQTAGNYSNSINFVAIPKY